MKFFKRAFWFICLIPSIWVLLTCIVLVIGIVSYNHIPEYGVDADPDSLLGNFWSSVYALLTLSAIFIIPELLVFSLVYLELNKHEFLKEGKMPLSLVLISIISFFLLKYYFPSQFLWLMD